MNRKQKKMLTRIVAGVVLLALAAALPLRGTLRLLVFLIPYAVVGWDVLWRALRGIRSRQVLDENFLMALATVGAFLTGQYPEAVAVMLFYQVGELFQSRAVDKSRQSISELMDIRPEFANIEENGQLHEVDPEDVHPGDIIIVKPGERIPLDGVVLEGSSALDTAALTGESLPRDVRPGAAVISGCINLTGALRVTVSKEYEDSTVAKILDLVENASEKKARAENFITKFARYYTPAVVCAAALLAIVPSLLLATLPAASLPGFLLHTSWRSWLYRAMIFLVISCPCALVISIPLSFFGGIGGASKCGILVKGAAYLELLARTKIIVFDKTGTLTRGVFAVTKLLPAPGFEQTLLAYAALAESFSDHPISRSLQDAYAAQGVQAIDPGSVTDAQEQAGHGVRALVDGHTVCAGNQKLMQQLGCAFPPCTDPGTIVYVAVDGVYAGAVVISDEPKPDAAEAIARLKAAGVRRTVMLTGDSRTAAAHVADLLHLDEYRAELLPADKVTAVESLLRQADGPLAFVGDGINDAPVLSRADIGIAMGGLGSDAAIEAADVVLMDDQPSKIALAISISRRTLRIARQNIVFALGVKAVVLLLGAMGLANMWEAIFADVGVAVIAILNAARALRTGRETRNAGR